MNPSLTKEERIAARKLQRNSERNAARTDEMLAHVADEKKKEDMKKCIKYLKTFVKPDKYNKNIDNKYINQVDIIQDLKYSMDDFYEDLNHNNNLRISLKTNLENITKLFNDYTQAKEDFDEIYTIKLNNCNGTGTDCNKIFNNIVNSSNNYEDKFKKDFIELSNKVDITKAELKNRFESLRIENFIQEYVQTVINNYTILIQEYTTNYEKYNILIGNIEDKTNKILEGSNNTAGLKNLLNLHTQFNQNLKNHKEYIENIKTLLTVFDKTKNIPKNNNAPIHKNITEKLNGFYEGYKKLIKEKTEKLTQNQDNYKVLCNELKELIDQMKQKKANMENKKNKMEKSKSSVEGIADLADTIKKIEEVLNLYEDAKLSLEFCANINNILQGSGEPYSPNSIFKNAQNGRKKFDKNSEKQVNSNNNSLESINIPQVPEEPPQQNLKFPNFLNINDYDTNEKKANLILTTLLKSNERNSKTDYTNLRGNHLINVYKKIKDINQFPYKLNNSKHKKILNNKVRNKNLYGNYKNNKINNYIKLYLWCIDNKDIFLDLIKPKVNKLNPGSIVKNLKKSYG